MATTKQIQTAAKKYKTMQRIGDNNFAKLLKLTQTGAPEKQIKTQLKKVMAHHEKMADFRDELYDKGILFAVVRKSGNLKYVWSDENNRIYADNAVKKKKTRRAKKRR